MISLPIRLAPMAGITDYPFRTLCSEMGADICYSEMVSAMGYVYAPKKNRAIQQLLTIGDKEGPVILQLFGRDPEVIAKAASELEKLERFVGIDINMGCPAHKVVGSNEGSALMKTPLLAAKIMEATVKAVCLPVSVKMRLGWDDDSKNVCEMAHIAQESGVKEIAIHGRTRMQQYSGKADWDAIALVKQAVKIPVLANGDIFSAQDAMNVLGHTRCDGILIGRGALGNPWLFAQIKAALNGESYLLPTIVERIEMALRHARILSGWKTQEVAAREMRKHVSWYIQGVHGAAQVRAQVNNAKSYAEIEAILSHWRIE